LLFIVDVLASHGLAELRLGRIDVQIDPAPAADGIRGIIEIHPRRNVNGGQVTMTLTASEIAVERQCSDDGTQGGYSDSTVVHTLQVLERSAVAQLSQKAGAGDCCRVALVLPLPEDVPPTLVAGQVRIAWTATVRIALSGQRDWIRTFPIVVRR
jgi:hypothetical protein